MTTFSPQAGILNGVRAQTSDAGRGNNEPLVWINSLAAPRTTKVSIWDFERDFTPAPPPAQSEINVDF
jgi:hypothetical protein